MKTSRLHPIVAAWNGRWDKGMRGARVRQHEAARKGSHVIKRRHRLVSDVFKAVERLGGVPMERDDGGLAARVHGVEVEFSIVERMRMDHAPLEKFDIHFRSAAWKRGYRSVFGATGRLVFKVETWVPGYEKRTWEEDKDGPDLGAFVDEMARAILSTGENESRRKLAKAEQNRREEEELERRKAAREAKERDERKWEEFCRLATSLRIAREATALLEEITTRFGEAVPAEGIEWAREKIARTDPVLIGSRLLSEIF